MGVGGEPSDKAAAEAAADAAHCHTRLELDTAQLACDEKVCTGPKYDGGRFFLLRESRADLVSNFGGSARSTYNGIITVGAFPIGTTPTRRTPRLGDPYRRTRCCPTAGAFDLFSRVAPGRNVQTDSYRSARAQVPADVKALLDSGEWEGTELSDGSFLGPPHKTERACFDCPGPAPADPKM